MLVALALTSLYELSKEVDRQIRDVDMLLEHSHEDVQQAAEDTLLDLGYIDIRRKDRSRSTKLLGVNIHDEFVRFSLKPHQNPDEGTRVSIFLGNDAELKTLVVETFELKLKSKPAIQR